MLQALQLLLRHELLLAARTTVGMTQPLLRCGLLSEARRQADQEAVMLLARG